jgi:cell division septum initiation protein DivIVA
MSFTCEPCDSKFSTKANFDRHVETDKHKKCCAPPPEQQRSQFEQLLAAIQSLNQTVSEMKNEIICLKEIVNGKSQATTITQPYVEPITQATAITQPNVEPITQVTTITQPYAEPSVEDQAVTKQKIIKPIKKTPSEKLLESAKQKMSDLNEKKLCYKDGKSYDKTHGEGCSTCKFVKSSFNYLELHDAEIQEMEAIDKDKLMSYVMMLTRSKIVELHERMDPYDMASAQNIINLVNECAKKYSMYDEFKKICESKYMEIMDNHSKCGDP